MLSVYHDGQNYFYARGTKLQEKETARSHALIEQGTVAKATSSQPRVNKCRRLELPSCP